MSNTIKLADGNYAQQILSYYLWGQSTAPSASEVADGKWIRDVKEMTVNIDAKEYMNQIGNNIPLAQQTIFQNFFNNARAGKGNRTISLDDIKNVLVDGFDSNAKEISLTHKQFAELTYKEHDKYNDVIGKEDFKLVAPQYNINIFSDDYWQRAFTFGSTSLALDRDSIRYVYDAETGEALRLENVRVRPVNDNFDFDTKNTEANAINSILRQTMDPMGIGRTVEINFTKNDYFQLGDGSFSAKDYADYTAKHLGSNNRPKWNKKNNSAYENGWHELNKSAIYDFRDEKNRIVVFGSNADDNLNEYTTLQQYLTGKYVRLDKDIDTSAINNKWYHLWLDSSIADWKIDNAFTQYLPNGLVYIGGHGGDKITGSNYNDVLIAGSNKYDTSDTSINTLIGGKGSDEIHGAAGADILVGGYYGKNGLFGDVVVKDDGESDRMEGGDGSDTYYAGDADVIKDKDGQGEVHFGDVVLGKAYRDTSVSDQQVYLQGENIKYTLNGKNLTVELIKEGKTLTIEEFNKENCDLNIQLIDKAGKDIVFVIDVTGSMSEDINTVKANVKNMISKLFTNTNDENLDTNIGIMTYTDGSLSWIAKNADTAQKAYSAINAVFEQGGGTELVATSLSKALNEFDWRAGEEYAKQIWLFGDEPGDDLDGLSKVYALSHNKKVELDGEKEGAFEYIPINTIALSSGSTASVFQSIAENTKGMYFYGRADLDTALNDIANLGTSADETINGTDANNTINGMGGDDTLSGGLGSDTYVETGDFGHDTLNETNPDGKDKNKVDFADTSVQDYGFENDNGNLVITNGNNSVSISDFYGDENKVDQFVFNDAVIDNALAAFYGNNQSGKNVNYTETAENVQTGIFGGRQFVVASDDAEVNTSWFQDAVVVNGNNVSVDTGLNNDQVYVQGSGSVKTGGGSDKIFIGSEFGSVNVYDSSGVSDEINFTAHNLKDFYVSQDGKNFSFKLLGSPESSITIEGQSSVLHRMENFSFSDGTNISYKDLGALAKIYENHSYEQIATDANIAKSIEEQLSSQGFLA